MDLRELRGDEFARHPWEVVRARIVISLLKEHLSAKTQDGGVILNLGCGDLYIASKLAALFPKTTVVAVDTAFDEPFLARARTDGLPANLVPSPKLDFDSNAPGHRIDAVLLLDVLEHIEDDAQFLKSLYESGRIHSNTVFIVTVPAFQQLFSSHAKCSATIVGIAWAAPRSHQGGVGHGSRIFLWSSALGASPPDCGRSPASWITPEAKGVGQWKGYGKVDSWLQALLWLDFRLYRSLGRLGLRLPGLSCYQVFRAPPS